MCLVCASVGAHICVFSCVCALCATREPVVPGFGVGAAEMESLIQSLEAELTNRMKVTPLTRALALVLTLALMILSAAFVVLSCCVSICASI